MAFVTGRNGADPVGTIGSIAELEALYDAPSARSLTKVTRRITPLYRHWIAASRFVVLSSVGPEGTDASPRGDDGPVVQIEGDDTVLLPDWRGNNRLDSLRNIVRDGRVSLMFLVPGSENVVRVNGRATLSTDDRLLSRFDKRGAQPRTVIVTAVQEMYFQCAKALMRSSLWSSGDESVGLASAGDFLREQQEDFDAAGYDGSYAEYARTRMW